VNDYVAYNNGAGTRETRSNGSGANSRTADSAGDILQLAYDADSCKLWLGRNNTWFGGGNPSAGTGQTYTVSAGEYVVVVAAHTNSNGIYFANFGQDSTNVISANPDSNGYGAFEYAPPSGFLALCSANLSTPSIVNSSTGFDVALYTGDGSAPRTISSVGHQPNMILSKDRSDNADWTIIDSVRGAGQMMQLYTNDNYHEGQYNAYGYISAFTSTGFTIGAAGSFANYNTHNFLNACWKEGAAYGLDVVAYTGTGAVQNISHNLGVVPKFIITKERNASNVQNWYVYHANVSNSAPATHHLYLDTTAALQTNNTVWNDTAPTSSVFTLGANTGNNESGKLHIAYLFAEIEGFSKFGYYIGNGNANGPFVYCGFRPRMIIVKSISAYSWMLKTTDIDKYNVSTSMLIPDLSAAEDPNGFSFDILSNGFKIRGSNVTINTSTTRHIFMAWAETPFKNSNAR
jgi:hypothetical protein